MAKTKKSISVLLIKTVYYIISFLVFLTKGEKRLVNLKVSLGIAILSLNTNVLYSQQNDSTLRNVHSKNDSLQFDVILKENIENRDDIIHMCYYMGDPKKTPNNLIAVLPSYSSKLQSYITKNIVYPKRALKKKIEGIVEVQFSIDTLCRIKNVKLIKGLGYGCDKEAIRIIKSIPKDVFAGIRFTKETTELVSIRFYNKQN